MRTSPIAFADTCKEISPMTVIMIIGDYMFLSGYFTVNKLCAAFSTIVNVAFLHETTFRARPVNGWIFAFEDYKLFSALCNSSYVLMLLLWLPFEPKEALRIDETIVSVFSIS